jgi:hypothetical protein
VDQTKMAVCCGDSIYEIEVEHEKDEEKYFQDHLNHHENTLLEKTNFSHRKFKRNQFRDLIMNSLLKGVTSPTEISNLPGE